MNERKGLTILRKAELASAKSLERQQTERQKETELFELFDANLNYANTKFQGSPAIKRWAETTGKRITLAQRRHLVVIGNRWDAVGGFPASRISVDQRGIVISHTSVVQDYSQSGYVDEVLTPQLAQSLWNKNEARSLIRSFASMSPLQINRKLSSGLK